MVFRKEDTQSEQPQSDESPILEYDNPQEWPTSSERPLFAAALGTVAGLFTALVLFYGIGGIVWLVRDDQGVADAQDVFGVVIFNLIGAVAGYAAVRWIRFAIRGS